MAKLYRVTIPVQDLERSAAFYGGLLGERGERVSEDWHYFTLGAVTLACRKAPWRQLKDAHGEPLYLSTEMPLVQLQARARQHGGSDIDSEIRLLETGERGFALRDPDGNSLCIVEQATVGWRPLSAPPAPAALRVPEPAVVMSLQRDFVNAVKGGELNRVRDLMMLDAELRYSVDSAGVSALMLALYKRHPQVAQLLLAAHEHLSVWEAAATGLDDRLAELLKARPELATAYSVDGFTPLGLACFFGHPANVSLLLAHNADVHAPTRNAMKVLPLHSAMSHDDPVVSTMIVRALLSAGADVNARQQGGYTALHQAADRGNLMLVDLLLEAGAEPSIRADNGRTPADAALAKGFRQLAQSLTRRAETV